MSRLPDFKWKELLMGYAAALLLSLGMSLALFRAFAPRQALWPVFLLCAGMTLVIHTLLQVRFRLKKTAFFAVIAALGVWGALGGGPVFALVQMGKAAYLSFHGIGDALAPYAVTARWGLCLLLSLLSAALYWDHTVPLALFTVLSMVGISFTFGNRESLLLYALPAAAGLLLMLAKDNGKRLSALPIAAALTALAFLLLPGKPQAVSPFKEAAQEIRQFVEDYLLFNEYRTAFSLTTEGFQPLNERLGGPAEPVDHDVLELNTDRKVLLRGKTYDQYTGLNWYDTLSARRYLAVSPRYTALREEVFDLNRPLLGGDSVSPVTMNVRVLNRSATTLFAPGRTRQLQLDGDRMVLYYNIAGEYFLTRDLEAGDAYTLAYLPYTAGTAATASLVSANAAANDPHYAEMANDYLQIPDHIQKEIYDIARKATAGEETPYEKALAIQRYLRRNYRYSLNVQNPPDGVDFIAWFLIGEQQGYCTYFASAMTMLCRIAGLPARYVTGYVALPNDSGVTVVTGENAHAWTEVYLNGFGWLAFDATPRDDYGADEIPDEEPSGQQNESESEPESTPEPTAMPTVAPADTPEPTSSPEPTEEPQDSAPTPTPIPPPPDDDPPEQPDGKSNFPWWLLLLFALIGLFALRVYLTEPLRQAERHPDRAVVILYKASSALLSARGLRRKPNETLHDFALRADLAMGNTISVRPLTDAYAAQVYGQHRPDGHEYTGIYLALRNSASLPTRMLLAVRRAFTRA